MIKIVDVLFENKREGELPLSFSLEKGNSLILPYEQKDLFTLLSGNFIAIESGEVRVDDKVVFPTEVGDDSFFTIDVCSLLYVSSLFFDENEKPKAMTKQIVAKLNELKTLKTDTKEEKEAKIAKIFEVLLSFKPIYLLVDKNQLPEELTPFVEALVDKKKDEVPFVILERTIAEGGVEEEKKDDSAVIQFEDKKKENLFLSFLLILKSNLIAFLTPIIPVVGIASFSLLIPLYSTLDNKFLYIFFLVSIIIYVLLFFFMIYVCSDFKDKKYKQSKKQNVMFFLLNLLSILLGYGIGVGVYFIVKNFDKTIKELPFNNIGLLIAGLLFFVLATANLYVYKVLNPLVAKIIKKKE